MSRINKFIGTESRLVFSRVWRGGSAGFLFEVMKTFQNEMVVNGCTRLYIHKNY